MINVADTTDNNSELVWHKGVFACELAGATSIQHHLQSCKSSTAKAVEVHNELMQTVLWQHTLVALPFPLGAICTFRVEAIKKITAQNS
jgi:hypothetical protein